jgi:hypothetical protein
MGESFEDIDSLSDISTEKSEIGEDEQDGKVVKKQRSRPPASGKIKDSTVDQKTKTKNREHAKKTRIRKKNYIESLKEAVKNFSDERERIDRDSRITLSRLTEQVIFIHLLYTFFNFLNDDNDNKIIILH